VQARPAAGRDPEKKDEPATAAARLPDRIVELIQALPAAVLWPLLGIAALAVGLAGNAFWQSRRRLALEAQRAALLDDVGLLSSALLPPLPRTVEGLAVSAAYRPADGPAAGGDFYDVFTLDEQRIGILLGDVSGHGRESVGQAALARYTLRTLLAAGHAPGEALARADRLLARELPPDFVTVIAGVYAHDTHELVYAKAGHAPPIVLGASHEPDREAAACPLGLGLGEEWPEFRLRIDEGVAVCLFTDGLEDARTDGARLGRDRVARLLAAHDAPDAEQLLADVGAVADVVSDDTAALVLRRAASNGRHAHEA
jgi:serine phosphatase RsbU (regulator of sigma subunit)